MAMVVTSRARFLTLCAMLALLAPGRALAADPVIKPALTGLISTGSSTNTLAQLAREDVIGIFGGLVVQATWRELQPTEFGPLNTTVIDNALTDTQGDNVTEYNTAAAGAPHVAPNNRTIGVRLRIFAGCSGGENDAPKWAMEKDNTVPPTITFPIEVVGQYDNNPETCKLGKFWDTNSKYAIAWRKFQALLAAKYDSNPLIQEVSVTSCTSFSAEPFFLNLKKPVYKPANTAPNPLPPLPAVALRTAGFTDAAYRECLTKAVDDYAPWKTTRLEFSFNGFSGLTEQEDYVASELIMRRCRLVAGQRCILSNHDLDTATPASILPVYVFERKFGPNITFQTFHVVPSDFEGTLRKGISLGASSIEVWQEPALGSFEHQTRATLAIWAAMFQPH
jgi:hypothetical protein